MKKFQECIAYEGDDVYKAYWNFCKTGVMTLVLNKEDKFVGAVSLPEYEKAMAWEGVIRCLAEITNYNCTVIRGNNLYEQARNIYADKDIEWLPVLDEECRLIDVFSRRRAFYKKYFYEGNMPYIYYARAVWAAATQAKGLGIEKISVIEFGVAGGNGLIALEFHAREIGRIFGMTIEVYGFDTGEGLPEWKADYRNESYKFQKGMYKMDYAKLSGILNEAQLILGDVHETNKRFWEMKPAPIGAVMVDVDLYTSTVPVLQMLETEYKNVLPRVYMYFDDIFRGAESIGESLAIKEFNERNNGDINISPEGTERGFDGILTGYPVEWKNPDLKMCHYFKHPLYTRHLVELEGGLPLRRYIL